MNGQHRGAARGRRRRESSARPLYALLVTLLGGLLITMAAMTLPTGGEVIHTVGFLAAIVGGMCLAAGIYEATGE